jgi:hypothetical protein
VADALALNLVGVACSLALWLAAVRINLFVQSTAIQNLPWTWREHPATSEAYGALQGLRARDLASPPRELIALFGALALLFFALTLLDVALLIQLSTAAIVAAYWTWMGRERNRSQLAELTSREDLPALPPDRSISIKYWSTLLLAWVGFVMFGCFCGRFLAALLV